MNTINIMGRLTDNPELKETPSGNKVCSFSVAVKRPHTTDKTDFINCVAWRNTAEFIARHFVKGKMIAIGGFLTSRKYESQQGWKKIIHEVVVDDVFFCGDKQQSNSDQKQEEQNEEIHVSDDDLPF